MSKRGDKLYLGDILDSIEKIAKYVNGLSFEDFSHQSVIIDAVVRNFEIIGEAVKNVSSELKKSHRGLPWKEMAGMRDKVIHEYFGVDLGIIWKTLKERLPELKPLLENIFSRLKGK